MLGGAGHSQKLVQKFMISDKSTFPPVIYSARALLHSPHCLSCMLSFFFSQCTRPFTAIVTTTPPGEKTKIQQRGARKKEEIIGNSTLGHASMALFMRFAVFTFFSAIFRVLFSGFSLVFFILVFRHSFALDFCDNGDKCWALKFIDWFAESC